MLLIVNISQITRQFNVQGTFLGTQKLLSDNRNMQLSHRPLSPARSSTPSRIPSYALLNSKRDQINKSPLREYYQTNKQTNQYLNNHHQRKCTSPIKSPIRQPSQLNQKNVYERSNNRSPLKSNIMRDHHQYINNRMPQSCYVPSTFIESTQGKQNSKSNVPLFSTLIKDESTKSQNCKTLQSKNSQKQGISFMSLIKKQNSLGLKYTQQNQQSYGNDKVKNQKGSVTTADFSSGKKTIFKDSLKQKSRNYDIMESLKNNIVLQKTNVMLDSVGTVSGNDRVNESVAEESFMDLNMDPCFDM